MGDKVGENPAARSAAFFLLSAKNGRGGGCSNTPPPPSRAKVNGIERIWCLLKIKIYYSHNIDNISTSQSVYNSAFCLLWKIKRKHGVNTNLPHNIILLGDFNSGNTYLDSKFTSHSPITPLEIALHDEFRTLNLNNLSLNQHDIQ